MFNKSPCLARGGRWEDVDERLFSPVDKSRQGSHSLNNANVCEMFHGTRFEYRESSYSHPGGKAAEAHFGASVAHNNHKIGVNP